jgi:hypothetical protein
MTTNPVQTISVLDMPLRARLGIPTLNNLELTKQLIDNGSIVTEVGDPEVVSLDSWDQPITCFCLRAPRQTMYPKFIFGGCRMGQAYSSFTPKLMSAPAVGSRIVIRPWVTVGQQSSLSLYKFAKATVHWMIHIPAPLGTGIYLKAFAPEFDLTTETRGVRWKPSEATTIAFSLPWSNDLSLVPIADGRLGQSGGSLVVETIEDNSVAELNSPINMTVFCCVTDIDMTGYNATSLSGAEGALAFLNFMPIPVPPPPVDPEEPEPEEDPIQLVQHMEAGSNEVSAEGGAPSTMETLDSSIVIPIAPPVEQPTAKASSAAPKAAEKKDETGHLGAKWYDYKTITLSSSDINTWKAEAIDASAVTDLGEAFNLPFKRNVWMSGGMSAGYMHGIVVQLNIARSPQISGLVAIRDSNAMSSLTYLPFGGKVEVPLIPSAMNGRDTPTGRPHMWLTPWLKTDTECTFSLMYNLVGFNRTTDIADVKIKIAIRPGHCTFHVPIKPMIRAPAPVHQDLVKRFRNLMKKVEEEGYVELHNDYAPAVFGDSEVDSQFFITPFPGGTAESTALHEELGDDENLDLDEFPVLVFDGEVNVDEVTAIPLNLAAIKDLSSDNPTENAITQKFQRFAHIIPKCGGSLGPIVGTYTIKSRQPTTVVGEFQHICLPGDMPVEIATRVFGLGSILSLASGALSALGGPLFNGIISTAGSLLSGLPGKLGGAAISLGLDTIKNNALGMINKPKPKPKPNYRPKAGDPRAISGDIPVSRFVEMIKPVEANYTANPVFPTLLIEPKNFRGYDTGDIEKVNMQVYANMRNAKVERNLFDRGPQTLGSTMENDTIIPSYCYAELLSRFVNHNLSFKEGSRQNTWFKKYLKVLESKAARNALHQSTSISEIKSTDMGDLTATQMLTTHVRIFSSK